MLARKQALLTPVLRQFAAAPVVDIGCGDIETLRPAQLKNVTGFDVSAQAVKLAREKRPDWTFVEGGADAVPPGGAALALCLDVSIHQPTREDYHALVAHVAAAGKALAGPGENDNFDVVVEHQFVHEFHEVQAHVHVHAVEVLGAVHGDGGDTAVVQVVQQGIVGLGSGGFAHAECPSSGGSCRMSRSSS